MPRKSIREMSDREKRRYSLSAKTFRASALGCILLGLVALIVGLSLYTLVLTGQIIRHAFDLANYASASVVRGADALTLTDQVMTIYHSLSEEEWQRMLELDRKDVAIPAEYMRTAVEIMRHGDESVPDYMLWL